MATKLDTFRTRGYISSGRVGNIGRDVLWASNPLRLLLLEFSLGVRKTNRIRLKKMITTPPRRGPQELLVPRLMQSSVVIPRLTLILILTIHEWLLVRLLPQRHSNERSCRGSLLVSIEAEWLGRSPTFCEGGIYQSGSCWGESWRDSWCHYPRVVNAVEALQRNFNESAADSSVIPLLVGHVSGAMLDLSRMDWRESVG
jgi:hypothetical protein